MEKEYSKYIKCVMREIPLTGKRKKEIELDLMSSLEERAEMSPDKSPEEFMGDPSGVAAEFRENLGLGDAAGFEYKSKKTFFNIPLVHINFKPNGVAKGILAIGSVAVGVVSIGAVALGLLAVGAFGMGILAAFSAVAFSGLISMGAAAFSIGMSVGAVAMSGYYAIGAFAQADIAIGHVAHGVVAVFQESGKGDFLIQLPSNRGEIQMAIQAAYPTLDYFWVNFVLIPF